MNFDDNQRGALLNKIKADPGLILSATPRARTTALMLGFLDPRLVSNFSELEISVCSDQKADFLQAKQHKINFVSFSDAQKFPLIFIYGRRNYQENLYLAGVAAHKLEKNGVVFISIHNNLGAKRLEDYLRKETLVNEAYTKQHCRVIVFNTQDDNSFEKLREINKVLQVTGTTLLCSPLGFSAGEIDAGSRLLAQNLPVDLTGAGADLGSGYGYLAHELIKKNPSITSLDLFENDYENLEISKVNLKNAKPALRFFWADLTREEPALQYDWIIMNPPFHSSSGEDRNLGEKFIRVSAQALKDKGMLYIVFNKHLPYPILLRELFSKQEVLADDSLYKVIKATK